MNNHITIIEHIDLPTGVAGLTDGHTIWLNPKLTTAGRRCTLAHELIHIDRGIPPTGLEAKEEHKVDRIAAHHITPTAELVDAILWTQNTTNRTILAQELNLDISMLTTRLTTVTDTERVLINRALDNLGEVA